MTRKSYIQINGVLYDKSEPLPEGVAPQGQSFPTIMPDLPDFVSPIDGKTYSGRKGMREHCAKHDVVPTAELAGLPTTRPQHIPDRSAIREALRRELYK